MALKAIQVWNLRTLHAHGQFLLYCYHHPPSACMHSSRLVGQAGGAFFCGIFGCFGKGMGRKWEGKRLGNTHYYWWEFKPVHHLLFVCDLPPPSPASDIYSLTYPF